MGTDQSLMAGEMLFAKFQSQRLRPIHRQTVSLCVARIKADNVVMTLDVGTG